MLAQALAKPMAEGCFSENVTKHIWRDELRTNSDIRKVKLSVGRERIGRKDELEEHDEQQ